MNNIQYKNSKLKLGMKNPDIWRSYFDISKDTDKSYSMGRLVVRPSVVSAIEDTIGERQERVNLLITKLAELFPEYEVLPDPKTNNITILQKKTNLGILLTNEGKDHFLHDMYTFIGEGNTNETLLYYKKNDWVHWSIRKTSRVGVTYDNPITENIFNIKRIKN